MRVIEVRPAIDFQQVAEISMHWISGSSNGHKEAVSRGYHSYRPTIQDTDAIKTLAAWTQSASDTMLAKTEDEAAEIIGRGHGAFIVSRKGELVGSAALTGLYKLPDGSYMAEVGSVFVVPEERGNGLSKKAIAAAIEIAREDPKISRVITLANDLSTPVFKAMRAEGMDDAEIPDKAWDACGNCKLHEVIAQAREARKNQQGAEEVTIFKKCCDTPLDLTNVDTRPFLS